MGTVISSLFTPVLPGQCDRHGPLKKTELSAVLAIDPMRAWGCQGGDSATWILWGREKGSLLSRTTCRKDSLYQGRLAQGGGSLTQGCCQVRKGGGRGVGEATLGLRPCPRAHSLCKAKVPTAAPRPQDLPQPLAFWMAPPSSPPPHLLSSLPPCSLPPPGQTSPPSTRLPA